MQPIPLWHLHELLFGFSGAALGGYLLTALPSWTAGHLVSGTRLKILVLFWAITRLVLTLAEALPSPAIMPVILSAAAPYFCYMLILMVPEILRVRAYSKLIYPCFVLFLGCMQQLFLYAALTGEVWICFAIARAAILGFCGLMIVVGGRAVPAFTRNWLVGSGGGVRQDEKVYEGQLSRYFSLGLLGCVLAFGSIGWERTMSATCLALAATVLWNMRNWQSLRVLGVPLLAALHLSYLWLPLGFLVVGGSGVLGIIFPALVLPIGDVLHVFTIGAMAGLIMAISGRAAAHQPNGSMRATRGFIVGFALIWLCTWLRFGAAFVPDHGEALVRLAAGGWCLGWLAFIVGFLPALRGPVQRPVLSGKRYSTQAVTASAKCVLKITPN